MVAMRKWSVRKMRRENQASEKENREKEGENKPNTIWQAECA